MTWSSPRRKRRGAGKGPIGGIGLYIQGRCRHSGFGTTGYFGCRSNLYAADPGDGRDVNLIRGIAPTSYDPAVAVYIDGITSSGLIPIFPRFLILKGSKCMRVRKGLYTAAMPWAGCSISSPAAYEQGGGFAEISAGNHGLQHYSPGSAHLL